MRARLSARSSFVQCLASRAQAQSARKRRWRLSSRKRSRRTEQAVVRMVSDSNGDFRGVDEAHYILPATACSYRFGRCREQILVGYLCNSEGRAAARLGQMAESFL